MIHVKPRLWKRVLFCTLCETKVEQEFQHLTKQGVIELVQFANWAALIVPVMKSDGSVHICGDFKITVNQASKLESICYLSLRICLLNCKKDSLS